MTRPIPPSITRRTRGGRPDFRRPAVCVVLAAAAVALAACGASSSASTTSTTRPGRTGGAGTSGGRQFPGASGTIAAINGTSLEVQNPNTGQTTVTYTSSTAFLQTLAGSAADVAVGSCISAFGKPTSGSTAQRFGVPVTATSVSVSQPTSGSCSAGFGRFRGGSGAPGSGSSPSGGGEGQSGSPPPGTGGFRGRGNGQFAAATGSVTAVNGSQATVSESNPRTGASTSVVVTLTAQTMFTQRTSASPSDLAVGKCATAIGSADSTGAVTARSITLSTAGPNGCVGRFGGFGAGGGAGGPGGGAPGGGGPTGSGGPTGGGGPGVAGA